MPKVLIAPSVLSADFCRMGEAIAAIEAGGADMVHIDVMDGHFVPNLTIGPPVVRAIRRATELPLDVHLMITNPDESVGWYLEAGADSITVHIETCADPAAVAGQVHEADALFAVTLNPPTPAEAVRDVIPYADMVLVMSVNPGFSGQSFIPESVAKVAAIREMCEAAGSCPLIQVDGGIDETTAPLVCAAGANVLVAGNAVYGRPDVAAAIAAIREAGERAAR